MAPASPEKRKWSARAWWLGLHVYVYAALAQNGALSPHALSPSWFALIVVVAVVNASCYVRLQRSTPGFVERTPTAASSDLEAGQLAAPTVVVSVVDESELASDSDSLVPPAIHAHNRTHSNDSATNTHIDASVLHYCDLCQLTQPLRTKHCKDCGKCVRQYDHHCDCAGTCVGEQNRRLFVAFLALQSIEGFLIIHVIADAITLQDSIDAWFNVNWPFLLAWFFVACELLIAVPLFLYQAFLISTNQTSWEHARRASITYLQALPDDAQSPFDRGCFANWRVLVCSNDRHASNKWVYQHTSGSDLRRTPSRVTFAAGSGSGTDSLRAPPQVPTDESDSALM